MSINRDICAKHVPIVVNSIKRLQNEISNGGTRTFKFTVSFTDYPTDESYTEDGYYNGPNTVTEETTNLYIDVTENPVVDTETTEPSENPVVDTETTEPSENPVTTDPLPQWRCFRPQMTIYNSPKNSISDETYTELRRIVLNPEYELISLSWGDDNGLVCQSYPKQRIYTGCQFWLPVRSMVSNTLPIIHIYVGTEATISSFLRIYAPSGYEITQQYDAAKNRLGLLGRSNVEFTLRYRTD